MTDSPATVAAEKARAFFDDLWRRGDYWNLEGSLFEQAKYMVGYAKIFSDFIESPEFLDAMLRSLAAQPALLHTAQRRDFATPA